MTTTRTVETCGIVKVEDGLVFSSCPSSLSVIDRRVVEHFD